MKLAMTDTHLYLFEGKRDRVFWYKQCREKLTLVRWDMKLTVWFN